MGQLPNRFCRNRKEQPLPLNLDLFWARKSDVQYIERQVGKCKNRKQDRHGKRHGKNPHDKSYDRAKLTNMTYPDIPPERPPKRKSKKFFAYS